VNIHISKWNKNLWLQTFSAELNMYKVQRSDIAEMTNMLKNS